MIQQTFRCIECKQDKTSDEFYTSKYKNTIYRRSKCKECICLLARKYRKHKRLPLSYIRPYIEEIVYRTGSERKAAQVVGVHRTVLRTWLRTNKRTSRDGSKGYATTLSRKSATRVLRTLHQLRLSNTFYDHTGKPGPKPTWLKNNDAEAERGRDRRKAA